MSTAIPEQVDLQKYIETRLMGDRPHIRGRRTPVALIASAARHNEWTVARLAYEYTLTEEQVLAALLYYLEHKDEIDTQDAREWEQLAGKARGIRPRGLSVHSPPDAESRPAER